MAAKDDSPAAGREGRGPKLPSATDHSREAAEQRRAVLARAGHETGALTGSAADVDPEHLAGNIEGFLGFARVPVGVFGPLLVDGQAAQGEFLVPVATSEGALVSSYQHVSNLLGRTGGIEVRCTRQGVLRAPCFVFDDLKSAAAFAQWISGRQAAFASVVAEGSRHCRLQSVASELIGTTVFVRLVFTTGDAAGQNMVTLATQSICTSVLDEAPVKPTTWLLEANYSGDKKATHTALTGVRGHRAVARAVVPDRLFRRYFRSPTAPVAAGFENTMVGAAASGAIGFQTNVANALAGLFIACGQDAACVAEAAVGVTRTRLLADDALEVSVTLPNLIVGTVGGGTRLSTARECLAMLGCAGEGHAPKLAELCAAVALCGEIALIGAMAGGSVVAAHATHGRQSGE
jgi:hydroxymethylglutaryl-CoA reductase (NADPH)